MHVLFLILDGLAPRQVRSEVMPTLTAMAEEGGWNRTGGLAVMPASTYPNHATFVTGVVPAVHGLWSSKVPRPTDDGAAPLVDAWEVGPSSATLFERCAAAGRSSAAVLGDQHLVGAMGAGGADHVWPAGGVLGEEVARDAFEYADDAATAQEIARAVARGPDLVVAQLNGPDTAAHLYGPDSEEALEAYRYNDAAIGVVRRSVAARWEEWVVLVVSDHGQEEAGAEFIDLGAEMRNRGIGGRAILDGSAAVVTGEGGRDPKWLGELPAVQGWEPAGDAVVAWGRAGSCFGEHRWGIPGIHGSPRTRGQVAVVSGGHPAAARVADAVGSAPPPATAWAGTVAELLGITSGRGRRSRGGPGPGPGPGR